PRPGTPAAELEDQVPEAEKSERLTRLQELVERDRKVFNVNCRGKTFTVLFEKPGRLPGQLVGRSPYLQPVQVMAPPELVGEVAPVTITDAGSNSLFGALVPPPANTRLVPEMQQA